MNLDRVQRVLIVDDEEGIRLALGGVLADEGLESLSVESGELALEALRREKLDLVMLDIWMPGMDGIETLKAIKKESPQTPVVMISGHATIGTAIQATKLGAADFIEKPLDLERTVQAIKQALCQSSQADLQCEQLTDNETRNFVSATSPVSIKDIQSRLIKVAFDEQKARGKKIVQKTLSGSALIYGHGVHSGQKSGLGLEPLPANSGIHFTGVDLTAPVPAHADYVESTGLATTLKYQHTQVSTIEHLMSALHAYGISNLLVKCNGEVPVLDGSALEFCKLIEETGVQEQEGDWFAIKVDRPLRVGNEKEFMLIEPSDSFEVNYKLVYPKPLGTQEYCFKLDRPEDFKEQISGARTFGFVRDIGALQKQGLGLGGRFDNFVLYGEDGPINGNLRYQNEAVRHKILDLIGDLYLLGRPIQAKITASMTGHSDNLAMAQEIKRALLS